MMENLHENFLRDGRNNLKRRLFSIFYKEEKIWENQTLLGKN